MNLNISLEIVDQYHQALISNQKYLKALIERQGFTEEYIRIFRLGYNRETNRITIPIINNGVCSNIKEYNPKLTPKYVNTKGASRVLWGEDTIDQSEQVLICAGEKDRMIAVQFGFVAVCSTTGENTWDKGWNELFRGKEAIVIYDNDDTGRNGALKVAEQLQDIAKVKIVDLSPICQEEKEDLQDFFVKYRKQADDLSLLIAATGYFDQPEAFCPDYNDSILFPEISFPFEVLPDDLNTIINKLSLSYQVSPAMIAVSMLTLISSALGNSIRVCPKVGWEEPPFLWLIIIAPSGYGKTPVVDKLMEPIRVMQAEAYHRYKQDMSFFEEQQSIIKKDGKLNEPEMPEPVLTHYYVKDFTVESLSNVFNGTPRGCGIFCDEIAGFFLSLNKYRKGNDLEYILELFNASPWKIDRKSGTTNINNTGASIIGGIQPKVLPQVFQENSFDSGLLPRFLFINPEAREKSFSLDSINTYDLRAWEHILTECYSLPLRVNENGFADHIKLSFSSEAVGEFKQFYDRSHSLIDFLNENTALFIPKLISYCLKLSGILHVLSCIDNNRKVSEEIQPKTVRDAIQLTQYFAGQAVKTISLYGGSAEEKQSPEEKRIINALFDLRVEFDGGRLLLSRLRETYNSEMPEAIQVKPEQSRRLTHILKGIGIKTIKANQNLSYVLWDESLFGILFNKYGNFRNFDNKQVTQVTQVTQIFNKNNNDWLEDEKWT